MGLITVFLAIIGVISDFIEIVAIIDIVVVLFMVFVERTDPKTFVAWLLILLCLPLVGFVLYLFLGVTYYGKHTFDPKYISDEKLRIATKMEEELFERDLAEHPKNKSDIEFAKTMRKAGAWMYANNGETELIKDSNRFYDALFDDIRRAKKFIIAEYYIIRNDKTGNRFMDLLTEKVKEGVKVFVLTDAFGNGKGPKEGIYKFKKAGGRFALFHMTINLLLSPKKNNRNHRKIAVIDGKVGYCGGHNIGDEYLGQGRLGEWRDTSVRVRGGGLIGLTLRFISDWNYAAKEKYRIKEVRDFIDYSVLQEKGDDRMQTVSGGPDAGHNNPIVAQYSTMIKKAKRYVYVHTPYIIPNDVIVNDLKCAAWSGVDVRIIIPDKPDHVCTYWNNVSAAADLMTAGIRIFMYNRGFVHSKTIVADGNYCSVGSANIDNRSLALNFETNAMIYSERIGKEMTDAFIDDLDNCKEYSLEEYNGYDTKTKMKVAVSRLFKNLN